MKLKIINTFKYDVRLLSFSCLWLSPADSDNIQDISKINKKTESICRDEENETLGVFFFFFDVVYKTCSLL